MGDDSGSTSNTANTARNGNLVIVESAAKGKTIAGYLNSISELKGLGKFTVVACFGHVCDLPQKELGVDTDTWEVNYMPLDTKKDVIARLRKAAKEAKKVYLCSDLDMEGHAISFHLRNILKLKRGDYERVTFNEITKTALKTAFLNPGDIDMKMVNAQETRRILDRVVGYKLSPLLWSIFSQSKLSAGRVQSAALNMIVQRADYINKHVAEVYWDVFGIFKIYYKDDNNVKQNIEIDAKMESEYRIESEKEVIELFDDLRGNSTKWIATFKKKKSQKSPPIPFITSSLQQEVYQRHHIPAKRTMQIAQNLYELGLITYMRTDSPAISKDFQTSIHNYLENQEEYGKESIESRNFEAKEGSQEAHECIHPTDINMRYRSLPDNEIITENHKKIYDLIWRRTVASQMKSATYMDIIVKIENKYVFTKKISILIDKGFLKVYQPDTEIDQSLFDLWNCILTYSAKNNVPIEPVEPIKFMAHADATRSHSLYNESSLIKALEKEKIGRPSTYATIIDKIYDKGYVKLGQNPQTQINAKNFEMLVAPVSSTSVTSTDITINIGGKETDRMVPTELGIKIIEYLNKIVPYLLDVGFTSEMEESLDKIANNQANKLTVLGDFYNKFKQSLPDSSEIKREKASRSVTSAKSKTAAAALQEYPDISANIISTKYGPAIYHTTQKKFYTLKPYLEWKKIELSDLVLDDIRFLISFPIKINDTTREVHIGQYGLYIKDGTENIKLPYNLWDKVRTGDITKYEIDAVQKFIPSSTQASAESGKFAKSAKSAKSAKPGKKYWKKQ